MNIPSIPFRVLALAPFRPYQENPWPHGPLRVDTTTINQVMEGLDLSLFIPVPKELCRAGGLTIGLKGLKDFHPDSLITNNPFLKNLLEARQFIEEARTTGLANEEISRRLREWPDLNIDVTVEPQPSRRPSESPIDNILEMVAMPEEGPQPSTTLSPLIAQVDSIIRQVVARIFAHNDLRRLESVWQGLKFFIKQGVVDREVALEIVPVSVDTLAETLNKLLTGMVNDPPSLIIVDLPFDNSPVSIALLQKVADFSETFLSPAICCIGPQFFYLDTWADLKRLPFLPHYLEEPIFGKWRHLQATSSAAWLAIACNRFLVRYPYGPDNTTRLIRFEESEDLWVSPVWAVASLIGKSLAATGWPTRFTEWKTIRLEDLAVHAGDRKKSFPTETSFTEDRMYQFTKAGIIPLMSIANQAIAFTPAETSVTGDSLIYQLFLSRVTHLLFWCKDHFEKDYAPADLEHRIQEVFSLFWEKTGHDRTLSPDITVSKPDPGQPPIVKLMIEPSRQVLPSAKKVELEFRW